MYEDLVKSLKICGTPALINEKCIAFHDGCCEAEPVCMYELMRKAADAIEELQGRAKVLEKVADKWCEAVPKWIPVTERLPDVFKHVLVNIPGVAPRARVKEAFRAKNGMWYSNGFRYSAEEITHWMPLPEPPKGET